MPGEIHDHPPRRAALVVVHKPHFLSTIPRGQHVRQSVVVRLRDQLGPAQLGGPSTGWTGSTAGVLLLATQRRWRGPYQSDVRAPSGAQDVRGRRTALGPRSRWAETIMVANHLRKDRGVLQGYVVPDAVANRPHHDHPGRHGSMMMMILAAIGSNRSPASTHQLRLHLLGLGIPIVNDPLYPVVREVA